MQTAFGEYTKKDNTKVNYYSLIMPQNTSTAYWMASRYVFTLSDGCYFGMRNVRSGEVTGYGIDCSAPDTGCAALALFPVVTLSSKLIKSGTEGTFAVSLE